MYAPSQKLSVIYEGEVLFRWSYGEDFKFFDLASLTKILFSAPVWMKLFQDSSLLADDRAQIYLSWWKNSRGVTISQLLSHTAGLEWWRPFYEKIPSSANALKKRESLKSLLANEVPKDPGTSCVYSDLDLFYLGFIAEEVFQKTLAEIWEEVVHWMGYKDLHFQNPSRMKHRKSFYAPTGVSEFRKKQLQGEVHDENAASFGGIAPHAGLFGGLEDLESFVLGMRLLSLGDERFGFSPEVLRDFTARKTPRAMGDFGSLFMKPTKGSSSAGRFFDESSFGHTGFTGTSIWYSPKKDLGVILLTNRVSLGVDLPIFKFYRPLIHDLIGKLVL